MKIIEFSILITFFVIIVYYFIKFIGSHFSHIRRMKNLDDWSKFNILLKEWASEIDDVQVRHEFLHFVQKIMTLQDVRTSEWYNFIDNWSFEKEKEKVYKKWGRWIPSLKREFRVKNLDKLLDN